MFPLKRYWNTGSLGERLRRLSFLRIVASSVVEMNLIKKLDKGMADEAIPSLRRMEMGANLCLGAAKGVRFPSLMIRRLLSGVHGVATKRGSLAVAGIPPSTPEVEMSEEILVIVSLSVALTEKML